MGRVKVVSFTNNEYDINQPLFWTANGYLSGKIVRYLS